MPVLTPDRLADALERKSKQLDTMDSKSIIPEIGIQTQWLLDQPLLFGALRNYTFDFQRRVELFLLEVNECAEQISGLIEQIKMIDDRYPFVPILNEETDVSLKRELRIKQAIGFLRSTDAKFNLAFAGPLSYHNLQHAFITHIRTIDTAASECYTYLYNLLM